MLEVAPEISAQPVEPSALRCHCHVRTGVGLPVTAAAVAVRVSPTSTVPAIVGEPVITGTVKSSTVTAAERVNVTATGGQTIDGAANYTVNKAYNGIAVWSDGSNWIVIQAKAT